MRLVNTRDKKFSLTSAILNRENKNMSEKVYANGLTGKIQETKFGNVTKLSIKVDDFISFLKEHENENGWVAVDLLNKRDNVGVYGVLNTFKPRVESDDSDGLF